jgi:hypothetical protein
MGAPAWCSLTWSLRVADRLDRGALDALFANEIAAIRVKGFASRDECTAFCAATRAGALEYYNVEPPVGYIGLAQYEYRWGKPKAAYFADVAAANAAQRAVFDRSFDPVGRVIEALRPAARGPVGIGEEPGLGPYFAGIVRVAAAGIKVHADFGPYNSPGYRVADIDAQLGWNVYFEMPGTGGETVVYNRPWSPHMEGDTPPQSYGLDGAAFASVERYVFRPEEGELVFFNVRNPHEVLAGEPGGARARISIGAFVGRLPDARLVLWS